MYTTSVLPVSVCALSQVRRRLGYWDNLTAASQPIFNQSSERLILAVSG